jgi:murein DD-endopeptidase MepM/ murein hydrolase activator NlpD
MGLRRTATALAALLSMTAAPDPARTQVGWTWPLAYGEPAVVRSFDPPAEPWQTGHRGVDLAAIEGEAVYAAGSGVVTYAGLVAGVGVVSLSHGELRTTYQPVTATVRAGEHVQPGEQIGTLDTTGSHCAPAPCLHWGLLRGDVYLDPTSLIPPAGRPRARLLPLGPAALGHGVTDTRADEWQLPPTDSADEPVIGPGVSRRAAVGALAGVGER